MTTVLALLEKLGKWVVEDAWPWLKRDYHWLLVLFFPVGLLVWLYAKRPTQLVVTSPELVAAEKRKAELEYELFRKDSVNAAARDAAKQDAQVKHDAAIISEIAKQERSVAEDMADPAALAEELKRISKEAQK
jgi:hypothetical protein